MRLINADAFDKALAEEAAFKVRHGDQAVARGLILARRYITDAPTVDVAPVVRCGECQYWKDRKVGLPDGTERDYKPDEKYFVELSTGVNIGSHCTLHGFEDESGSWLWSNANDFCSRGKRKDGDNDARSYAGGSPEVDAADLPGNEVHGTPVEQTEHSGTVSG